MNVPETSARVFACGAQRVRGGSWLESVSSFDELKNAFNDISCSFYTGMQMI